MTISTPQKSFSARCGSGRAIFELAPWIGRETAQRFSRRGYEITGSENVVVCVPPFPSPAPIHPVVLVDPRDWPELMLRMNGLSGSGQWRPIAGASAILPDAIRVGVRDSSGEFIVCAQVQPAAGVALFGSDATLKPARGRGAQTATIQERLRAAAALGFSCADAEVAPGSTSERNYLRCGFRIAYTRACYGLKLA
jgi:hypothetical protein